MDETASHWMVGPVPGPDEAGTLGNADVAVVGGGIMGVSMAYWLAIAGARVLLLESRVIGGGASGRNAGLMLHSSGPLEDPTLFRTVLQMEGIDCGYHQPGHLALASSEEIWSRIREEAARRAGDPNRVHALKPEACESLLGMRIDRRFLGGRWLPSGGLVHPIALVRGLARAAARLGARIVIDTVRRVSGARGRFRLETLGGSVEVGEVVFTCQAALGDLVPELSDATRPVTAQMLATSPLPPLFRVGLAVDWGSLYWRQADDGVVVLGGGQMFEEASGAAESGANGSANGLDCRIQRRLEAFLPDAFPGFPRFTVGRRWVGIMDVPADGRPLIGALPTPGMWAIAGFGGHGLPPALGATKAIADSIFTGVPDARLEPYAPSRLMALSSPQRTDAPARA